MAKILLSSEPDLMVRLGRHLECDSLDQTFKALHHSQTSIDSSKSVDGGEQLYVAIFTIYIHRGADRPSLCLKGYEYYFAARNEEEAKKSLEPGGEHYRRVCQLGSPSIENEYVLKSLTAIAANPSAVPYPYGECRTCYAPLVLSVANDRFCPNCLLT